MTREAMAETGAKPAPIEQDDDQAQRPPLRADFYLDDEAGSVEPIEHHRQVTSDGR